MRRHKWGTGYRPTKDVPRPSKPPTNPAAQQKTTEDDPLLIDIFGHLVNPHHIVNVSQEGERTYLYLTGGRGISVPLPIEEVRDNLAQVVHIRKA